MFSLGFSPLLLGCGEKYDRH